MLHCHSVTYHLVHTYTGMDYNISQMTSKPPSPGTGSRRAIINWDAQ